MNKHRKFYNVLSARERFELRHAWFVICPAFVPVTRILEEFGISRQTLYNLTTKCGFEKTPEMYQSDFSVKSPGAWHRKLVALYEAERRPNDEANVDLVYFDAVVRTIDIRTRFEQERANAAA